ncbi:hypothetical protein H1D32_07350 [Anaerobacillus sp. CMMVII]|uniref:hypothetical protein n=1 Tax=Anaerobacillus sp. CMMVII TaxID=2755588 RepID=UPI0021B80E9F|nr:hypothetical protein [Anaerobacillus sp. CMMVII]MCT8137576.1 hypothetical protein [Anaerobacillus sp. CMMVII]
MKNVIITQALNEAINGLTKYGIAREQEKSERSRIASEAKVKIEQLRLQKELLSEHNYGQHLERMGLIQALNTACEKNSVELASLCGNLFLQSQIQDKGFYWVSTYLESKETLPNFNRQTINYLP